MVLVLSFLAICFKCLFPLQEMARLHKEEYREQIKQELERHATIAAQRAEERYRRHYDSCYDIVGQIVDFACKVAEYRELTEK